MSDVYEVDVPIKVDTGDVESAFGRLGDGLKDWGVSLDKMYEKGSDVFKKFGIDIDQFASKLGTSGEMLTGFVGAGVAAVELGKKFVELGEQFDEASSTIERTTGASGVALDAMNAEFEDLMSSGVSQNINDVAAGFSLLAVKLRLSGEPLEKLTKNFTEYAEVTGTSVKEAISSMTDVMNKWNISTADAPELLDQLDRASQLSGVSAQELAQELKSGGAQLQELGLSLTDSAAMLAAFADDGVNAQTVLVGLRTAVREYAKEGKDAGPALQETFDQIKNAKSPTEALTISMAAFGSKAGPEMANAIRSGKASIEDFKEKLEGAQGTVKDTADKSQTLGEAWKSLCNELSADFAPVAKWFEETTKAFVNGIAKMIREIKTVFQEIGALFGGNIDQAKKLDAQLVAIENGKETDNTAPTPKKGPQNLGKPTTTPSGTSGTGTDNSSFDNEWYEKAESAREKDLEEQKAAAIKAAQDKNESATDVRNTAIQYDNEIRASYTERIEKERAASLAEAKAKGDNAATIKNINKTYDEDITEFNQAQIDKRNEAYQKAIEKEADEANRSLKEGLKAQISGKIIDTSGTGSTDAGSYGAQIAAFFSKSSPLGIALSNFGDQITKTSNTMSGPLGDALNKFGKSLSNNGNIIATLISTAVSSMSSGFSAASSKETDQEKNGDSQAEGLVNDMMQYGPALGAIIYAVEQAFTGLFQAIGPVVGDIMGPLSDALKEIGYCVGEAINPLLKELVPIIKIITPILKIVGEFAQILITAAIEPLVVAFQILSPAITFIGNIFTSIANFIESMWNGFASALNSIELKASWPWGGTIFDVHPFNVSLISDSSSSDSGSQSAISVGGVTVSGYASGTNYATGGYHLVGEQGPELAYIPQGAQIADAKTTAAASKSTTINATFNSPTTIDATEATKQLSSLQRKIAFQGSM